MEVYPRSGASPWQTHGAVGTWVNSRNNADRKEGWATSRPGLAIHVIGKCIIYCNRVHCYLSHFNPTQLELFVAVGSSRPDPDCLTVPASDAIELDFGEVVCVCVRGSISFFLLFVVLVLLSPGFQLSPESIYSPSYIRII